MSLTVRSSNGLKRADIHTFGHLKERLETENGLINIRNIDKRASRKSSSYSLKNVISGCYHMRRPTIGRKYWTSTVYRAKIKTKVGRNITTKRNRDDDAALGCVVYALSGLFLMPIIDLVLVCSKYPEKKAWDWILLFVGVILWIVVDMGNT